MGQPAPTAPSGRHFDAKVFAKLFQKHECEHGVGHEADASRQEALDGEAATGSEKCQGETPAPATPALTPPQPHCPRPLTL